MKSFRWNIEHTLYILIFLLALALRLVRLGAYPLSNFEAGWALQALDLSVGRENAGQVALGPNPGYALGTSLLFPILGDTNAAARILPALVGAGLIFLPLCFRRQLGQGAALILALGLALDPGLVAVSRTAGGGMPALVFGLFALAAISLRKPLLAGFLAGLALLSGVDILAGTLGLALTWGLAWLLDKVGVLSPAGEQEPTTESTDSSMLRSGLYFLAGALLFIGTLFFWRPQGLGGLASTLPAYLDGWGAPSGIPLLRMPVSLLVYQPLAVIFGILGVFRGWLGGAGRRRTSRLLSLWALAALVIAMVYPARQVSDLIWVLVPLWALAAVELDYILSQKVAFPGWLVSLGQAVFLCLLAAFAWLSWWRWLTTRDFIAPELYSRALREALVMEIGALALAAITLLLVSLGWSCGDIVSEIPGNAAAFFPSYGLMEAVGAHLRDIGLHKDIIVEKQDMGKDERIELYRQLVNLQKGKGGLLLGVQAGSLSEGVDYANNMLDAVIIVGLPLESPSLETKALIEYYDFTFERGWDYGYIFPAMNRVLQAAGRCIRSETDKGAIILMDERFKWKNYSKCFPLDMQFIITEQPEILVKRFFGRD